MKKFVSAALIGILAGFVMSAPAGARQRNLLESVQVDLEAGMLYIYGHDFGDSSGRAPRVKLGGDILVVDDFDDGFINAILDGTPEPGTYRVYVARHVRRLRRSITLWDSLDVAIGAVERVGKKVGPNLYEVHSRTIWDGGWREDAEGYIPFSDQQGNYLTYGPSISLFYSPLSGYGEPPLTPGATRMVRLYVVYAHHVWAEGIPRVRFEKLGGGSQVEFELPGVSGEYWHAGANWSDFKEYSEYSGIGHAYIDMFLSPSSGGSYNHGAVYRIYVHYYDQYDSEPPP